MPFRRVRVLCPALALVAAVAGAGPAAAAVDPLVLASGPTPFAPGCNGFTQTGTVYRNAEVEPYVAADPTDPGQLIAVWQQDRFSNGGANGLLTAVSDNGGQSWTRPDPPPFSRCAGGNSANGGDYERATDPWVSVGPDGRAYQVSLSFNNDENATNAILVSRSQDGGLNWGALRTVIRDTKRRFFNDKESITADPGRPGHAYVVWDRLDTPEGGPLRGPTYFSRTVDGGASWEPAHPIYDPGPGAQTIGNQIAVLPDGVLVNVLTKIVDGRLKVAAMRSADGGQTWSAPVNVSGLKSVGVTDPRDGDPVRTADVIPDVAVDPRPGFTRVYAVWQDARFTGGGRDQIAFARSGDGGRTWSAPQRVSSNLGTQAFTPAVEVDSAGNVGVTYYDFTNDTATNPLDTDYWFARSSDKGRTFGARERLTPASFNMRSAPQTPGGYFVGDYEGLTVPAGETEFKSLFVATTGDKLNRTDVFSTTVTAPFAAVAPARGAAAASPRPRRAPGVLAGPVRAVRTP